MMKQIKERIAERIGAERMDVFVRADFKDEGSYAQVGRSLLALVRDGVLIHMGHGLYGRAAHSPFDGRPVLAKGFPTMVKAALARLGIEAFPSQMTAAYNAGTTTQVPSGRVIGVNKRVRRRIGVDGIYAMFERYPPCKVASSMMDAKALEQC